MKWFRRVGLVVVVVVLAIAAVIGTMRLGWWNPSYEDVVAAHATPPSQFIDVDGVRLHIRDEGEGPAIIMLHSSMSNLRIWDAWADRLKQDYRVIRFDWPPYGLSVTEKPSTGMPGVVTLLESVVDHFKLDEFALVGSSSGATISVLYASEHPEKVRALALSALPLKAPPPTDFSRITWGMIWLHQNIVPNYNSRIYYRRSLADLYGRPERLKDETVEWYYQTNNIPGGFARVREYYEANRKAVWAKGAGAEASRVTAPILLQWGDADPVLPVEMADAAVADFANAKVRLIHYPDAGHYPMIEIPDQTGADVQAFLDEVFSTEAPKEEQVRDSE